MNKTLLALGAIFLIAATACAPQTTSGGTTSQQVTPAQVIADLNQAATSIQGTVPQLVALPNGLTQAQATKILADVAQAQADLATVSVSTALDASLPIMQRVFGALNTAVTVIEAVNMPAQDKTIVVAAGIVLQAVEAYLNSTMPVPPANPTPAPSPPAVNSARATLRAR